MIKKRRAETSAETDMEFDTDDDTNKYCFMT